jgi:predicted DCC family thiol-disulfide oxidoreductase YuxK
VATHSNPVILYDGICGLCNRLVRFVLKRDSADRFRFASLQSDYAAQVLARHGVSPQQLDTMYVVLDLGLPDERLASRADAAIAVLNDLGGFWAFLGALLGTLPRWLRNWGYNRVARNRYRIFGKFDSCPLPEAKHRHKFLDTPSS